MNLEKLRTLPSYTMKVSELPEPSAVLRAFARRGIRNYIYTIACPEDVIKHGMSCPRSGHTDPGDRLYRQLGHLNGWNGQPLQGASGADLKLVVDKHFPHITRNDITVTIYDATNYSFFGGKLDLEKGEHALVSEYEKQHKRRPYGNIQDTAPRGNKAVVANATFGKFFKCITPTF